MADMFTVADTVPHVVHHVKHATHYAAVAAPVVSQGVSMLTILTSNLATAVVAAGLAWYIRGRGMTGVKIDIANAQAEIAKIKAQIAPVTPAAPAA